MLYFTLSNFYLNFNINNFINIYNKQFPDHFKEKVAFASADGNFPYCIWNGGFNNCCGIGETYNDFIQCLSSSNLILRLNCSNIFLEDYDKFDIMGNTILKTCDNGSTLIEISNLQLMEYIKGKFPDYQFVFSKNADLINPFTSEILNQISEQNDFQIISLPERFNTDINFLKSLSNKNKIELTINPICNTECSNFYSCRIKEHEYQLEYSSHNSFLECQKRTPYRLLKCPSLQELKKKYCSLGINNFKLGECINSKKDEYLLFLIDYFIKPEYQYHALTYFIKGANLI